MKNCILTTASDNIKDELTHFTKQARRYHSNDDIVIVMPDYHMDTQYCKELKKEYNVRIATYSIQFCNNLADLMTKRFIAYEQYLQRFEYNKVFICDCRDLHFQGNIFDYNFDTDIVCFKEANILKGNPISNGWLEIFKDSAVKKQLGECYNLCLGTLLGTYKGIFKFIKPFLNEMFSSGLALNNDQIIFNYLIYLNKIEGLIAKLETNETGPVATIGDQVAHASVKVNDEGIVLIGETNHIPAVIHQYDRLPQNIQQKFLI